MPAAISELKNRTAQQYLLENNLRTPAARARLLFAVVDLINHLRAEMHSRPRSSSAACSWCWSARRWA